MYNFSSFISNALNQSRKSLGNGLQISNKQVVKPLKIIKDPSKKKSI